MTFAAGQRLGPYEILSLVGSGGMGEVYRARDPKLNRVIAIKVLPEATAANPERRTRFEREAQSIAALSHPNIVTIYSVEEAEGVLFLTMEYVEGTPLSDVIGKGGLSFTRILTLAIPMTEAISAAHEKGIIHRDLKPANVMLSTDGRVKVLDFGLAKLMEASSRETAMAARPTSTLTDEGRIVGTVAYMSPEQAEGKPVDSRSDVFSLGILLYEMATGERPFKGDTNVSVLSAIVKDTPRSITDLNPAMPREFARVVKRCLAKEKERRCQTALDVRNELEELQTELESGAINARGTPVPTWTTHAKYIKAATIVTVAVLLIGALLSQRDRSRTMAPIHRQITFVGTASFPAISPDGNFLAYIASDAGSPAQKLIVQDLSGSQPLSVFTGERLEPPVWSNDGSQLLIASNNPGSPEVRIVPRLGGPARSVGGQPHGQSWSPDNARFASINQGVKRIFFVDTKTGGMTAIPLTGSFTFLLAVDWSPKRDLLLFETLDNRQRYAIWTILADGRGQQILHEDEMPLSSPRWSPTGDAIYYFREGDTTELVKLPFNLLTARGTDSPQIVLTGLQTGGTFTISADGKQLAYTRIVGRGKLWLASTKLSPDGAKEVKPLTSGTARDAYPSISPDGRFLAFSREEGNTANIFVVRIDGGTPQQITFRNSRNLSPVWSPDGNTIAFVSTENGQQQVWQVNATGGTPVALEQTRVSTTRIGLTWAPGSQILYQEPDNGNFQILNPVTGEQRPLVENSLGGVIGAHTSPSGDQVAVLWNRPDIGLSSGLWVIPLKKPSEAKLVAGFFATFGGVNQSVDGSILRGRDVTLVAHLKTNVSGTGNQGQCWLRVDRPNGKQGFFDTMHDRPVKSTVWAEVTIAGKVDDDAERVAFGCFLAGTGQIWVDDIELRRKNPTGQWEVVPIKNAGFEESDDRLGPAGWAAGSPGYTFQITDANRYKGQRCLVIKSAHNIGQFVPIGWSADEQYLYAIEPIRWSEVVMIRTDGAEIRPLIELPLHEGFSPGEVAITPDGHKVVYTAYQTQSDVWIVQNFDSKR